MSIPEWSGCSARVNTVSSLLDVLMNTVHSLDSTLTSDSRGGGLGSRPKKMYGERLGDGVEYHLMSPTPHC